MPNDATETVIASNGQVYVAPVTTVQVPDDVGTALGADWVELGFVSEEGATFSQGQDITDINAWQSFYPVRRVVSSRTVTVAFELLQWNEDTLEFALGGNVTSGGGGEYVFVPPAPEDLIEHSVVVAWQDGTKDYRLYIPRGIVSENVDITLSRTDAAGLPLTFAATDPGSDDIYTLFTNDTAFVGSS